MRQQLAAGNVVLLSNLGYSAAGEVLNCDIYSGDARRCLRPLPCRLYVGCSEHPCCKALRLLGAVATRAAIDLAADKLILLTTTESQPLVLPLWLPLSDAEAMLRRMAPAGQHGQMKVLEDDLQRGAAAAVCGALPDSFSCASPALHAGYSSSSDSCMPTDIASAAALDLDFDRWYDLGLPPTLLAACVACRSGIKRAHLVDALMDGGLLLELYSRDGVGSMISTDFYEGIRHAGMQVRWCRMD